MPESPAAPAPPPLWRIAAISFVALALELAFIRQIPAEVKAISYFTNLVLMASFFGLGLGCILQGKRSLLWLLPAGVLLRITYDRLKGHGPPLLAGRKLATVRRSRPSTAATRGATTPRQR